MGLARVRNFDLVDWFTNGSRRLPDELLQELRGQLVDRKVTYDRAFDPTAVQLESELNRTDLNRNGGDGFTVKTVSHEPDSIAEQLITLQLKSTVTQGFTKIRAFWHCSPTDMYTNWILHCTIGALPRAFWWPSANVTKH